MEIRLDLQIFAEAEKTEEATPKKRRDAREEGQVVLSKEVNTAFILLAAVFGLRVFGEHMIFTITEYMDSLYSNFNNIDTFFTENNIKLGFLNLILIFIKASAPIVLISFFISLLVTYLQVGFLFTTKPLEPKLSRINPIEGFKRIFSKRALVELAKSLAKLLAIGYIPYSFLRKNLGVFFDYPSMVPSQILENFSDFTFKFTTRIIIMLVVIGVLDYLYQWWRHEKDLMMTKDEIKEEYRQTEGDPQIKSKIKEKQRQLAQSRMMQDVPKADVIITNPTHLAVAIRYDKDLYSAPVLLAKGADEVAFNIKEVAKENSIPIVENKVLARGLYETVDIGELIPENMYEAVAEVLAYVYSLKDR